MITSDLYIALAWVRDEDKVIVRWTDETPELGKGMYADLIIINARGMNLWDILEETIAAKEMNPWDILEETIAAKEMSRMVPPQKGSRSPHNANFICSPLQSISNRFKRKASKVKRGLASFVNGARLSVIADTGATQNVISAAYVKERKMIMEETSYSFKLGNSTVVKSMGTVLLDYAFAEERLKVYKLVCHVLPHCIYYLVLGNPFLVSTETLAKHRHRLTQCLFSTVNMFHLSFLGNNCQLLEGTLADRYTTYALPDTGAERNVMSLEFAEQHGQKIWRRPQDRGYIQFVDGTYQETIGRVHTYWTFNSGERIPVTFEVLENCCHDVILGEDVLWDHNVFRVHAASIHSVSMMDETDRLAPFGYEGKLEKLFGGSKTKENLINAQPTVIESRAAEEERRRRWNYQYGFDGAKATMEEQMAEAARQKRYKAELLQLQNPLVPSISTAGASQNPGTGHEDNPKRDRKKLRKNADHSSWINSLRSRSFSRT